MWSRVVFLIQANDYLICFKLECFNEDFLNEFTKPHLQFVIFLFVAMGIHEFNLKSFKFMIIDALIFTIIINIVKKLSDNYKSKKKKEEWIDF